MRMSGVSDHRAWDADTSQTPHTDVLIGLSQEPAKRTWLRLQLRHWGTYTGSFLPKVFPFAGDSGEASPGFPDSKALLLVPRCSEENGLGERPE